MKKIQSVLSLFTASNFPPSSFYQTTPNILYISRAEKLIIIKEGKMPFSINQIREVSNFLQQHMKRNKKIIELANKIYIPYVTKDGQLEKLFNQYKNKLL